MSEDCFARSTEISQYSLGLKALISSSRSTTNRSATDWTRPADWAPATLLRINGLSLKPTKRSRMRRACCASTSWWSIWRGSLNASMTASLVISWKTTLRASFCEMPRISLRCHDIASPSRSGSVARYTLPARLAAVLSSLTTFRRSETMLYFGSKSLSTSTPIFDFCRSRTCPTDAFTAKPSPK